MKIKFIAVVFVLSLFSVNAQLKVADVKVKAKNPSPYPINKNISGGFVEMLRDFVNGPLGIWGQDFYDRGFDHTSNWQIPVYWDKFYQSDTINGRWQMVEGGYNKNGKFYQKMTNPNETGLVGLSQLVYVSHDVESSFYVWAKSVGSSVNLKIKLINPIDISVLFEKEIGSTSETWQKFPTKIPNYLNVHKYILAIYFEGKGELDIDEASLMPDNNIDGIRKEYFELFKLWNPGVIRYPGGGFADVRDNNWYEGIGEIDQRKSPLFHGVGFNVQRLDWGTDEFIQFCKNLNIEPHIVVNLAENKPQDAANWVEYCNGDTNTYFGRIRANNGHPEPYNVNLWEIGNEQYGDEIEMAQKYLTYYDLMKKVDSNITIMIDGNVWVTLDNFDILLNAVKNKCDVYGWHWAQGGVPKRQLHNDSIYYNMVAGPEKMKEIIEEIDKKISANNINKNLKQGITEWWLSYIDNYEWLDTTAREQSLEAGLSNACYLQTFTQYQKLFNIAERTVGLCNIRTDTINGTGQKKIYGTPAFYSQVMMSRHSGNTYLNSDVWCEKYKLVPVDGLLWITNEIPFINVAVTRSNDSIFISLLNRSLLDTFQINFSFDYNFTGKNAKLYQMRSESYLDLNTPEFPDKIKIEENDIFFDGHLKFPPHSFSIIAYKESKETSVFDNDKMSVKLYPNPCNDFINLLIDKKNLTSVSENEIEIVDIFGRTVSKKNIQINQVSDEFGITQIDTSNLLNGFYFIKYQGNTTSFIRYK